MNEKIQEAIDYMEKMGWIKINEHLDRKVLAMTIREYIAKASFRDIMDFSTGHNEHTKLTIKG